MYLLTKKLKWIKEKVGKWNKISFGNMFHKKDVLIFQSYKNTRKNVERS